MMIIADPAICDSVLINEFMALNCSVFKDESGEYEDWIELYNPTDSHVDVGLMYLSDDPDEPYKWRIPAGTVIGPGGYLLIWADGQVNDGPLHASFSLASAGEGLYLYDRDGIRQLDAVVYGAQRVDISYGRDWSDGGRWRYMIQASPGGPNGQCYAGVVEQVCFSHVRGFYEDAFDLELEVGTDGAYVLYTLDGSIPYDPERGFSSTVKAYNGPIRIDKTTVVRAVGYKLDWLPSTVQTHTYIFLDDVIRQDDARAIEAGYPSKWSNYPADYQMDPEVTQNPAYAGRMKESLLSIPSLSIATDRQNLFAPATGIYTNPLSEGQDLEWERPVSIELFGPNIQQDFQIDCGLRIQGGHSRHPYKCPKHSLGLRFRDVYGTKTLDYDLFGGPVRSFDSLQLRGGFNNSWIHWDPGQRARAQYIRDHWARDTLIEMGNPDGLKGFSVHLYINGMYWGLYMLHERPNAEHYAAYKGLPLDEPIDAINGDPTYVISDPLNTGQVSDGTIDAWLELKATVASRDWAAIQRVLDVDNFIDWTILNYFSGNVDLKQGTNWRAAGGGPSHRPWRFYCWDMERILEDPAGRTIGHQDPTGLFSHLKTIPEFQMRFADRVHRHMFNGGALTEQRNLARWLARSQEVDVAVIAESARWGDYRRDVHQYQTGPYYLYTRDEFWVPENRRIIEQYFPARNSVVLQWFKDMGLYPSLDAPIFYINGAYQHGGQCQPDDLLSMALPGGASGQIYYCLDGSDPRLPEGLVGQVKTVLLVPESAPKRLLVPKADIGDSWRGGNEPYDDSGWDDAQINMAVNIGGVGYERQSGYEAFITYDVGQAMYGVNGSCYIRIPFEVSAGDLGVIRSLVLRVRCDDGFVAFINGKEVASLNRPQVLSWDSVCANRADSTDFVEFAIEDVSMLVAGRNILAVQAINQSASSSDLLFSAELIGKSGVSGDPRVNPQAVLYTGPIRLDRSCTVKARVLGTQWSALAQATYCVGDVPKGLRISEIMYHPAEPNCEFIELTNISEQPIDLGLVRFSRGIEFTFPNMALEPGRFVLVVQDLAAFESAYGTGLPVAGQYTGSLDNAGEGVVLTDPVGKVISEINYSDGWFELTDGMGFSLVAVDPGADPKTLSTAAGWRPSPALGGSPGRDDDMDSVPGPGAIVINEIMARPGGNRPDWIEFYNNTDRDIDIGGWYPSDDPDELTKYQIPAGMIIPAGGYRVLYQDIHFGRSFGLSADGEQVILLASRDGKPIGFMARQSFGPSLTGISLGRYVKANGADDFVAMAGPTPGSANSQPKVGPVVIAELMYNVSADGEAEYMELVNISPSPVTLFDPGSGLAWRITGERRALDYTLASDQAIVLEPGQRLILTRSRKAFYRTFASPQEVLVLEWGVGGLGDDGDDIRLFMPDGLDGDGQTRWILVDRVRYSDGSHPDARPDLWAVSADGQGKALGRIDLTTYGNDQTNWQAIAPSPGRP
ncbi:MAG: lamin tail domain-containing protein [Sedimentisphaerales bacterium]|nr:lamin tail domain-containing protein [Sedimentisphaerales bacterium]